MELADLFYAVFGALGYILLQSLFILGVRAAAGGGTEIMPDGREKDSEMILYPMFKFLMQSRKENVYYSGERLSSLVNQLALRLPQYDIEKDNSGILLKIDASDRKLFLKAVYDAAVLLDNQIQMEVGDDVVRFYKVYDDFRFNKYLRKPLLGCPLCMASFWGIFTYWFPVIWFVGFSPWVVYLGIINTCCVCYSNWLLFKRI